MSTYRVMIVDEDSSYRWDLQSALERDPALRVVAEAGNGHEALAMAESAHPDLILINRRLPGLSGLQVAAAIRRQQRRARVLLLTPVADYDQSLAAVHAGAAGVLPRTIEPQTLRNTARAVLDGTDLLKDWTGTSGATAALDLAPVEALADTLTTREMEVLDCLLMGLSTRETGAALEIADQTVKNRVSSILHKLRVAGRLAAIKLALSRGWAEYGPGPQVAPAAIAFGLTGSRAVAAFPPTSRLRSTKQVRWV